MKAYLNLTRAGLRAFRRDRQGMFWSFFFPFFFMCIFGLIFGKENDGADTKFDIGIVAPQNLPAHIAWMPDVFRHNMPVFKAQDGTLEQETQALREGKVRAVLVFPEDIAEKHLRKEKIDVKVLFGPGQPQITSMIRSVIDTTLNGINQTLTNSPTLVASTSEEVSVSGKKGGPKRGFDVILPGIMAMTVMQLGLFTAITFITLREKGTLKRMRATPLPRSTVIISQVTQRLIIGVVQTLTLVVCGTIFFKFQMQGSWLLMLVLIIYGVLTFICIGAVLSAIAKTQESGVSLVQLVNFPMMFLSGMFFPLELLPDGLRSVVSILPSTHLASLMRYVMVNEPSKYGIGTSLGVMFVWLIGGLFIASRTFRWE